MKESELRSFFEGDIDAAWLGRALESGDAATSLVTDLDAPVRLTSGEMVRLCDAHIEGALSPDDLQAVAGLILESDNFAWDEESPEGELVAEVLWDWAMPEDEAPPTSEAVVACRRKLSSS
ncbi:MAG TPA: hypothetical protein VFV19_08610 [Candidatus Polarisedimenticolaceae bacterium]|nr:hypothetical protein [Candidatus Polarisedimenticolaceae bacterium]